MGNMMMMIAVTAAAATPILLTHMNVQQASSSMH
jgi:hypothetical protein